MVDSSLPIKIETVPHFHADETASSCPLSHVATQNEAPFIPPK